jgi:hypothetical protein
MKTLVRILIATVVMALIGFSSESNADGRGGFRGHRGHGGVSIWLGPGWGPGWWGPYYNPYYYPYYQEPIVVEQRPEIYLQPLPQAEQQPVYWYYCKNPQGYYPYVKQCPDGWMKVVPTPPTQSTAPPN